MIDNPHEMTRLELEIEVIESRKHIKELYAKINHLNYIINVYCDYLGEQQKMTNIKQPSSTKRKDLHK